jgi:hypothetical protein
MTRVLGIAGLAGLLWVLYEMQQSGASEGVIFFCFCTGIALGGKIIASISS